MWIILSNFGPQALSSSPPRKKKSHQIYATGHESLVAFPVQLHLYIYFVESFCVQSKANNATSSVDTLFTQQAALNIVSELVFTVCRKSCSELHWVAAMSLLMLPVALRAVTLWRIAVCPSSSFVGLSHIQEQEWNVKIAAMFLISTNANIWRCSSSQVKHHTASFV